MSIASASGASVSAVVAVSAVVSARRVSTGRLRRGGACRPSSSAVVSVGSVPLERRWRRGASGGVSVGLRPDAARGQRERPGQQDGTGHVPSSIPHV